MAKNTSPANRALWVIAFSLAVIAVCLIIIVLRQVPQNRDKTVEMPATEPETVAATEPRSTSRAPKPAVSPMPIPRQSPARPSASPERVVVENTAPAEQPAIQPVSAVAVVSSGYAPLTVSRSSNGVTTISGRVILKGSPPPENPIPLDLNCGRLDSAPKTTRHYLVSTSGGLANVFVYIKSGLDKKRFSPPRETVVLDQTGCFYEPYVLGLMVNQTLRIKNSDKVFHNVHATPRVNGNHEFNLAESPGTVLERRFSAPEIPLRLKCDAHPWMFAYVCVVENPFFAVTDAEGNYAITNVPPGDYVLEAYHVKTHGSHRGETQRIEVAKGETTKANFTIELPGPYGRIARNR